MKPAQSVLEYVRKRNLLRAGDRVGVAVSGGSDSVALLRLLLEMRAELGIVLSVAHFNHKLRGAESDGEEEFVSDLASQRGLPFRSESGDVKAYAAEKKVSVETAARALRYGFFQRLLESGEYDKIATGHTLDDQAETVLLKMLRGTGTRGLAGIYPKVSLAHAAPNAPPAIIRPLLATGRPALEQYLRELDQPWREDSSNRDLRHTRNRIRRDILPGLEQINPCVREALADLAEIARAEEDYWARQNAPLLSQAWAASVDGGALCGEFLHDQPLAMQRRLVRAAAESLPLGLEFRHVEEILALAHESAQAALPDGWTATLNKGAICFSLHPDQLPEAYEYPLAIPAKVRVPEAGLAIETELIKPGGREQEFLADVRLAEKTLTIRNWRHGDRFWSAHSKAPKKIKELLQDHHITGARKKLWPVIASGDEVVWMYEFGIRRNLRATNGSGIFIRATPLDS